MKKQYMKPVSLAIDVEIESIAYAISSESEGIGYSSHTASTGGDGYYDFDSDSYRTNLWGNE